MSAFTTKVWVGVNAEPCTRSAYSSPPTVFTLTGGRVIDRVVLPQKHPDAEARLIGLTATSEFSAEAYVTYPSLGELWQYRISKGTSDSGEKLPAGEEGIDLQHVFSLPDVPERLVAGTDGDNERIWLIVGDRAKWSRALPNALLINSAASAPGGKIAILYSVGSQEKSKYIVETFTLEGKKVAAVELLGFGSTLASSHTGLHILTWVDKSVYLNFVPFGNEVGSAASSPCPELEGAPILIQDTGGMLRGLGQRSADHQFGQFLLDAKCHVDGFSNIPLLYTAFQSLGEPIFALSSDALYTFRHNLEYHAETSDLEVETFPLLPSH